VRDSGLPQVLIAGLFPAQANLMAMLEKRAERKDVEAVTFGGPVDRGPADGAKFMRGWQYQVTGKPAAAAVLHDFNVKRIKSGEQAGLLQSMRCCACHSQAPPRHSPFNRSVDCASFRCGQQTWSCSIRCPYALYMLLVHDDHINSPSRCSCCFAGGAKGIQTEALQYITENRADDTFYVVDLANVLRMFKVGQGGQGMKLLPRPSLACGPLHSAYELLHILATTGYLTSSTCVPRAQPQASAALFV
jgi:hypothetical protein